MGFVVECVTRDCGGGSEEEVAVVVGFGFGEGERRGVRWIWGWFGREEVGVMG